MRGRCPEDADGFQRIADDLRDILSECRAHIAARNESDQGAGKLPQLIEEAISLLEISAHAERRGRPGGAVRSPQSPGLENDRRASEADWSRQIKQ